MTGAGPPVSAPPPDPQYERMHRRVARRAVGLSVISIAVGVAALMVTTGWSLPVDREVIHRQQAPGSSAPADGCRTADLAKPAVTTMPAPVVVTAPVTIRPGPDLERLSPPDGSPAVAASRAWELLLRDRAVAPSTAGSTEVLLGDLYAATPAVLTPGRPARPVFDHTLVWAIYGRHQPERPSAGEAADAPCYFESTVFYVDARTGRALVAEVFPPALDPTSAV